MLEPRLLAALAAGSTVVTPNKRLARTLVATYDAAQRAAGRGAWPAVRALPWAAWVETLWHDVLACDALPAITRRLPATPAQWCWQQIVAAEGAPLLDTRGAATLAAEAWSLLHAWGAGGESWRGWRESGGDDSVMFARWAERFHAQMAQMRALDDATLADALTQAADTVAAWRDLDVVLAGFRDSSLQQERLIAALARQGARMARLDAVVGPPGRTLHWSAASPREEIRDALTWARVEALGDPHASIGIAVLDLGARREEIRASAEDILCPGSQLPGNEGTARPYNLSLGAALSSIPLAATALDLIELAARPLPVPRAAVLLRSPYLPDAESRWPRRAALENNWLASGYREISRMTAGAALLGVDPAFGERFRRAQDFHHPPAAATPADWTEHWRGWLAAIGWPGDRPLDSAEQQTREAFDLLLADFAGLATVTHRMHAAEAIGSLRVLANATLFQPEAPAAPIQIVGMLEAAGLPFDRLWIAGLAADQWPPAPQPNPFLPAEWQRAHAVPRSSAARELAFARTLTDTLARGAPEVVVSHARHTDDHPRAPSRLIDELGALPLAGLAPQPSYARAIHAAVPALETVADFHAPPLGVGVRAPGGARIVAAQSDCPFQAIGTCRLKVGEWPRMVTGLTAIERGKLVHAALAAFWRDVRDQATLAQLDESALAAHIDRATVVARRELSAERWRTLEPPVAAGETRRLTVLLRAWVDAHERPRPPFAVVGLEEPAEVTLAGVLFRLRLDRIDRIPGGTAIIDYKTGVTPSVKAWFEARPRVPQLGLYALAKRNVASDDPLSAVAYAQLRPGDLKAIGVAADVDSWPALIAVGATPANGGWTAFEDWWREHLTPLALEISRGVAYVAPRDGDSTCSRCDLAALCRIRSTGAAHADDRDA